MMKLRTFLQDNIAALLCAALLAVMSIIAWRLLTPSPDHQLTPTYALADTALPPLHDTFTLMRSSGSPATTPPRRRSQRMQRRSIFRGRSPIPRSS